jgi:hypothetical protein
MPKADERAARSALARGSQARASAAEVDPRSKPGAPAAVDFKKDFKALFAPPAKAPVLVEVPEFTYAMIDGQGYPGKAPDFQAKIGLLYGLAYTIKFALKKDALRPFDFAVPPMSGFYCADDPTCYMDESRGDEWKWTLAIPFPSRVTPVIFEKARKELREKKNPDHLDGAYLKKYREGLSAQIMHIGPYSEEAPTIQKLHAFFQGLGYAFAGPHHEIYLGDPRRTAPEKLKTVLRQPVIKK